MQSKTWAQMGHVCDILGITLDITAFELARYYFSMALDITKRSLGKQ